MKGFRIIIVSKRALLAAVCAAMLLPAAFVLLASAHALPAASYADPRNGVVVIDPGHGGIDGGTNQDGLLEKDVNLDIAKRLRDRLTERGYTVVMTREDDRSLEEGVSRNRHARDLRARVDIINESGAQLFISIHVNCMPKRPSADGAVVFYGNKFEQNHTLALYIQRALNLMETDGERRTAREPVRGKYYLFGAEVPGVIVETAFLSNSRERELLLREDFREQIACAVADGAERYLLEQNSAPVGADG